MNVKLPLLTTTCHYCRGRSASWSANMSSANISTNRRNHILPILPTRSHYWGVYLPVDLPIWTLTIWALTVEITYCHSWRLDATTRGSRSASRSANMTSNSRNLISPFLTIRCHYWEGVDLPVDLPNMSSGRFAVLITEVFWLHVRQ